MKFQNQIKIVLVPSTLLYNSTINLQMVKAIAPGLKQKHLDFEMFTLHGADDY